MGTTNTKQFGSTDKSMCYQLRQLHSVNYLERDVLVLLQEHAELADTDPQVSVCELVGDVESEGSKLPPLQSHTMEDAEGEQ